MDCCWYQKEIKVLTEQTNLKFKVFEDHWILPSPVFLPRCAANQAPDFRMHSTFGKKEQTEKVIDVWVTRVELAIWSQFSFLASGDFHYDMTAKCWIYVPLQISLVKNLQQNEKCAYLQISTMKKNWKWTMGVIYHEFLIMLSKMFWGFFFAQNFSQSYWCQNALRKIATVM
jgi:hypothetical protein